MSETLPFAALVFDVGGVIIPHDNDVLYRLLAQRCRGAASPEAVEALVRDPRYERGELPIADLHERLAREAGYALPWADFVGDWCSHLAVDPAMLDYVERLAATRRVLLFSNTNREHWDHLLQLTAGRLGRFEAYLSHEIGVAKPSLASYRLVAARAGIDPARALFVDDRAANVEAARRAGFHGEVFTGQAALQRLLATR